MSLRKYRSLPKVHTFDSLIRDPNVYPDYDEFRPERFLDGEGNHVIPQNTHGQGHVTYGKLINILYSKISTFAKVLDAVSARECTSRTMPCLSTSHQYCGLLTLNPRVGLTVNLFCLRGRIAWTMVWLCKYYVPFVRTGHKRAYPLA